jgi:hypothetical protein
MQSRELTHLSFGELTPPNVPFRTNNSLAHTTGSKIPLKNKFDPITEQGSRSDDIDSERLGFGSMSVAY